MVVLGFPFTLFGKSLISRARAGSVKSCFKKLAKISYLKELSFEKETQTILSGLLMCLLFSSKNYEKKSCFIYSSDSDNVLNEKCNILWRKIVGSYCCHWFEHFLTQLNMHLSWCCSRLGGNFIIFIKFALW